MTSRRASVENEKQYGKLKRKGMSKERAVRIANTHGSSSRSGKQSASGSSRSSSSQGGATAQKSAAGHKAGPRRASAASLATRASGELLDPDRPLLLDDEDAPTLRDRVDDVAGQAGDRGLVRWAVADDKGTSIFGKPVEYST
jgi:hypothetical protein